ncbi:hypothetical protein BJF83_23645 [Nocardiopsis sp. CNR-923]|nr:hypothetical protein BJF83_23645 [Nocardiopsis sp. CNR-923]
MSELGQFLLGESEPVLVAAVAQALYGQLECFPGPLRMPRLGQSAAEVVPRPGLSVDVSCLLVGSACVGVGVDRLLKTPRLG